MDEPTPPRIEDFGLTEEEFTEGSRLIELDDADGLRTTKITRISWHVKAVIGILLFLVLGLTCRDAGGTLLLTSGLAEDNLTKGSLVSGVFLTLFTFLFLPAGLGILGVSFITWCAELFYLSNLTPVPHVRRYFDAVRGYEENLRRYEWKIEAQERGKQRKEEEKRRLAEEYKNLSTDWERKVHKKVPEQYRFIENGLFRIEGEHLLRLIDWKYFEKLMAFLLNNLGWEAETTSMGADRGVDVIAISNDRKLYLQAKHYRSGTNIGREDIQKLIGTAVVEKCTHAIIASSSGFTRQAREYLQDYENDIIQLMSWDGTDIGYYIDQLSPDEYRTMIEPMKRDLLKSL